MLLEADELSLTREKTNVYTSKYLVIYSFFLEKNLRLCSNKK